MRASDELLAQAQRKGFSPTDMIVRDLLPYTDLAVTGATTGAVDIWNTPALTAVTSTVWVNRQILDNQFVAIYGVAIEDPNPSIKTVTLMVGTASTHAIWNLQEILACMTTVGISEEFMIWRAQDVVRVTALPQFTKAGGDFIQLMGIICEPRSQVLTR